MGERSKPTKQNPYKILYWMGAGLFLLSLGVVALVLVTPKSGPPADPSRLLLWLYDAEQKEDPAVAGIMTESLKESALRVVVFAPNDQLRQLYAQKGSRAVQDELTEMVDRQIHKRLFLPFSVLARLIDAVGGVSVAGESLQGLDAVAFIKTGGDHQGPGRAAQVLLALAASVAQRGISISPGEGISLLGQIDLSFSATELPAMLTRWTAYPSPLVESLPSPDHPSIQWLLGPDQAPGL